MRMMAKVPNKHLTPPRSQEGYVRCRPPRTVYFTPARFSFPVLVFITPKRVTYPRAKYTQTYAQDRAHARGTHVRWPRRIFR